MQRRLFHGALSAAFTLTVSGLAARAGAQTATDDAGRLAAAQAIYAEAIKAMDAKDYAVACPKLEDVARLVPEGVGARLTLARCYVGAEKLATAYEIYVLAEAMAEKAKQPERQQQAHAAAKDLMPKLARLTIAVAEGVRSLAGLTVQCDGVAIGAARWGEAIPVDRGRHVVTATAAGKQPWEKTIEVSDDGESPTVALDTMMDVKGVPVGPAEAPPAPPTPAGPATAGADATRPPARSLSHRGQLGAVLRADVDGQGPGIVPALGFSYGIGDHVEVAVCALVGRTKGVEPGVTLLLLRGTWKPRISVGVPIFFVDGARPGVRASAGVQWDPIRHVGLFVEVGVAAFPNAPDGYQRAVFVPSVGVQPRL